MEVEVQAGEEEVTAEESSAEESAAFSATFDKDVRVDETPTETEEATETEQVETTEAAEETEQPAEVETQPTGKAGLTDDQLTEMLAKLPALENMTNSEIRKVYGKLGEINRVVQELQGGGGKSTGGVKITPDKLKRISEEFGEDFAKNLADDLNDVFGGAGEAEASADVDSRVAAVKDDLTKQMNHNLLLIQHRDYPQVVQSPEFKVWMQTLPAEEQAKLNETWDAVYLGDKFTEFKSWRDKKTQGTQQRQQRLERAITPKGNAAPVRKVELTEEDGFAAAFKG